VNSKKNVLVTIGIIMFVMLLFLIINITVNLRNFGFQSADTKAQLIAQSVKNGLTAHMVNGIMDKNDLDFVLSIVLDTKEEYDRARDLLPLIEDYANTAKPEIVSKKLMQILEKSAFTDLLTTLFNRKYLETYIDSTLYAGEYKNKQQDFWKYIKQTDIALYEAKQTGRNKVVRYTENMV
jgi:predicted signal transduction protein with EAL and GGDEF domain